MIDSKAALAQTMAGAQALADALTEAQAQADSLSAANVELQAQLDTANATIADLRVQLAAKSDVPAGYRAVPANASHDAIQAELDKGGNVYLPAGRYSIDAVKALKPKSNSRILLHKDAVLVAQPNAERGSNIFLLDLLDNVTITGGQLVGDRDTHLGTDGEGGMGIRLHGSTNVTIDGVVCSGFWGDGVVVGPYKGRTWTVSRNVVVRNVTCTGCRRNGMSIGNVVGFLSEDCTLTDNGNDPDGDGPIAPGTSPFCGLDVEPDPDTNLTAASEAHDLVFRRLKASGNHTHGVNVWKRVYNVRFEDCDLSGNGSVGLKSIEAHGITLTGNRVSGNETAGVQIGVANTGVSVSGNTFSRNGGAQARQASIVKDGIVSTRDLAVNAADRVIGVNTYA